ncbi:hypothetical protein THARTR1_09175 [Trichoderma harzianum]|uniref:Ankyrin repeat protein n=1 Tax=Trichoderma harzianum TaxID=5544 RepID=A0A2K0TXH1_TRIHA|nr:hypothetical protein THARTR1_09175 [Trichoderma harzianum]
MPADHSIPDEQPQETDVQGSDSSDDSVSEEDLLERDFEKMVNAFRKSSKDILKVKSEVIPEFRKKVIQKLKSRCTWFPAKLVKTAGSSVKKFEKYRPLLEALLEECPDFPAWKDEEYEATTMHIAMRSAEEGFIRFLCERSPAAVGALSMMTKYQKNCLYIAIEASRETELIQYLITCVDRGTVDSVGQEMNTPLHLAVHYDRCRNGQLQIVEGLLQVSVNSLQKENEFKSSHNYRTLTGNGLDTLRLAPLQYHIYSRQNSKASAEKDKVADEIAALLRMHCLRLNLGREKTLSLLYGELQPKAITFDLWGYETVREEDLDMLSYLDFETVLQAVVLPELKVIPLPPGQVMQSELSNQLDSSEEKKPLRLPECPGRTDYCRIFRWLRMRKVDKILRVSVQDRVLGSHSDESIEWCLGNMGVEIWDWNRLDICFTTIKAAAPLVRKLTLYSSGNNAVLRSWADENGLCTLPDLREVHVEVLQVSGAS